MQQKKSAAALLLLAISAIAAPGAALADIPIRYGVSPDNGLELLLKTIASAQQVILINIYQLDQPTIVQALTDKIAQGVVLQILVEGEPAQTGLTEAGKQALSNLLSALQSNPNPSSHVYLMTRAASAAGTRRYAFDHAKYVIVDGRFSLISSENFSTNGFAPAGHIGNRGWQTVVADAGLAGQLQTIFEEDSSTQYGDVEELTDANIISGELTSTMPPVRAIPAIVGGQSTASAVTLITSPHSQDGLVNLIESTQQYLRVEFMEMPLNWKTPNAGQNPLVAAILGVAKRGAHVHVLLNDESAFTQTSGPDTSGHTLMANAAGDDPTRTPPVNPVTVAYLNQAGLCQHLDIQAGIVSVKNDGITFIHNKGIVVDQSRVLVSSINGTENSIYNNREVAAVVESPDAAGYFNQVFDFDWKVSAPATAPAAQPCNNGSAIPYLINGEASLLDFFTETRPAAR